MSKTNGKPKTALIVQCVYDPEGSLPGGLVWGWGSNRLPTSIQELKEMLALLSVAQQAYAADLNISMKKLVQQSGAHAAPPSEAPKPSIVVPA